MISFCRKYKLSIGLMASLVSMAVAFAPELTICHAAEIQAVESSPVDKIPKLNIGRVYGVLSGGMGQDFFQNGSGATISSNAGLASGSPAGIFSATVGYEFRAHRHFYIALDVVGRFMFMNDLISFGPNESPQYSITNTQQIMFQVKPTLILGDGKYGLFLMAGVGGHFGLANGGISPTGTINQNSVDLSDFAVSYGIGGFAAVRPHIAIHFSVFSLAPLTKSATLTHVINASTLTQTTEQVNLILNSYGFEIGIKFFT